MLDTRKLEYFLKVCETGSINTAAGSLFISPQALSKSIDSLEKELGTALFERSVHGLKLTACGELLQQEGRAMLNRFSDLERRVLDVGNSSKSTVSLSFFSGMLLQYPEHFFSEYVLSHPEHKFRFYSYMDNHHGRRNAYTGSDLFFATSPMQPADMKPALTISRPLCALVGEGHPLAKRSVISLQDLQNETVFAITSDLDVQAEVQERFRAEGISFDSFISDAEQSFSYDLVRAGAAISFFAGPAGMVPPGTRRVPLSSSEFEWTVYIYTRKSGPSPAAAELLEHIRSYWSSLD